MKNILSGILFLLISFSSLTLVAQKNQTVFSIDGDSIDSGEFIRLYKKNSNLVDKDQQENITDYLRLFIDYKLKLKEAEREGLDTVKSFLTQFKNYKKRLGTKYMLNTKVSDQLIHEAYDRLQTERNVSQVLLQISSEASPEDTLKAYKKIKEIRKKYEEGTPFDKLALTYSEDPGAKKNNGKIGWIGVFTTVYPFETVAYQTPVGEVSQPVRTRFGYHLIKVNAERKNEGKVQVAQIFLKADTDSAFAAADKRIHKIYRKLQNGSDFSNLAKQFSEDKNTAAKGGKMRPFAHGHLTSTRFEDKAFQLTPQSPLSAPFKTDKGWHIIKLLKEFPIRSYDEEKGFLKRKIKKDKRSLVIRDSVISKLKKKYAIEETDPGLDFFKDRLGGNFLGKVKSDLPDKDFISLGDEEKSYADFYRAVKRHIVFYHKKKISPEELDKIFANYKDNFLFTYERDHLAEHNKKYARALDDYRAGLLIYAVMDKNVWQKAQTDTLGLKKYYQSHKTDFRSPASYDMNLISADSKRTAKKIRRNLKKGESLENLQNDFPEIIVNSGNYSEGDSSIPDNFKRRPGVSKVIRRHGVFMLAQTKKVHQESQKSFEEAKGAVMNAYQKKLEKDFVQSLRDKSNIKLNEEVIKALKREFE